MPDITIRGWKCDMCGKEFYERNPRYKDFYHVSIKSTADSIDREDWYFEYVCQSCKDEVIKCLEKR